MHAHVCTHTTRHHADYEGEAEAEEGEGDVLGMETVLRLLAKLHTHPDADLESELSPDELKKFQRAIATGTSTRRSLL